MASTKEFIDGMEVECFNEGRKDSRVNVDGKTVGFITKWYDRGKTVNRGKTLFCAECLFAEKKMDCKSYIEAKLYILNAYQKMIQFQRKVL